MIKITPKTTVYKILNLNLIELHLILGSLEVINEERVKRHDAYRSNRDRRIFMVP